jgi:hypothetical protein
MIVPGSTVPLGSRALRRVVHAAAVAALTVGACANPTSTLVIVQNQQPTVDDSNACVVSSDSSESPTSTGLYDVDLDQAYPYYLYPLIQNRLPSIKTTGGIERNSIVLRRLHVTVHAPPGVDAGWDPRCPATFDSPATVVLDPAQARAVKVEGMRVCHGQRLRQLIAEGAIPADTSQPVYFTLEVTAVADRAGSEQLSDSFPFQVQVCAGCLQSMYPLVPACADAPHPNPFTGNPCNIAQDKGTVLCCRDPGDRLICPAP